MKFLSSVSFTLSFSYSQCPYLCCICCYCSMVHKVLCWIYGFVESTSTGDHRKPRVAGTKVLEAALPMLPARKCFRAEASGQNWEQKVVMALSSCSFNKAQEVMMNYRHYSGGEIQGFLHCQLCFQPSSVPPWFGLCLKRKVFKPTAQFLMLEVT